ncbi:MAG: hypothetical protein AAFU33_23895, partial [Bacteroidota bacterium]
EIIASISISIFFVHLPLLDDMYVTSLPHKGGFCREIGFLKHPSQKVPVRKTEFISVLLLLHILTLSFFFLLFQAVQ